MDDYGQLVHVEELFRDGIQYMIAVFRVQGGLHGEWSCENCAAKDQNGVHPTVEETVMDTKKFIDEHHANLHKTR